MDSSLHGNPSKRSEISVDVTHDQIINNLSETVPEEKDSSTTSKRNSKRQRKNANPTRYIASERTKKTKGKCTIYWRNVAYEVIKTPDGLFCNKCSCCICHNYVDNKDACLWLPCDCDPPFVRKTCVLSYHLDRLSFQITSMRISELV